MSKKQPQKNRDGLESSAEMTKCWDIMRRKFAIGQVVAYRADDGGWEYDRIARIRPRNDDFYETAWLARESTRIGTKHLRPLTRREAGNRKDSK